MLSDVADLSVDYNVHEVLYGFRAQPFLVIDRTYLYMDREYYTFSQKKTEEAVMIAKKPFEVFLQVMAMVS